MIGLVTGLRLLGTATMKTAMDNSMKKVILFIHGFAGHPNQFKLFYPEIPDGYDYHALLLAGHGGSVDDFGRASMKEWQNQVDEIMVELRRKIRRDLRGRSFDGNAVRHAKSPGSQCQSVVSTRGASVYKG